MNPLILKSRLRLKVRNDYLTNFLHCLLRQESILLKIDTQGYEDNVIRGAGSVLDHVEVIIVETSFGELYEGQPLFADDYELLHERGFVYAGSWMSDALDRRDGSHLQQDSIFVAHRST